jgi:hypothetical protein
MFERRNNWSAALALVALIAGAPSRVAARPAASTLGTQAPAAVAGGLSTIADTPAQRLAQAAGQLHMTICAPLAARVTDFLLEGVADANFTVQPMGPDANVWPTVIVMESAHPDFGRTRLSTITLSPSPRGCSAMYEQVIHWAQPCASLKADTFAAFQSEHVLNRNIRVSEANPGLQLYLIPAGEGCVSVKKELLRG